MMRTIPSPSLPAAPCDVCGRIAWARIPLIGGQECICTACYPVRTWSPVPEEEFAAAHHTAKVPALGQPHRRAAA
jgi:hypothetical protein